ncbi:SIR2 family protein [Mesorhizobium sp. M1348]|uniref:SIR2 family protein n=1 Tax=unclassified Mesorhizobium TaxID=325217 RepID=UPI00333725AB
MDSKSGEVVFVGAGASFVAGCPLLSGLFKSVAGYALAGYGGHPSSAQTRLAEYLHLVHGLDQDRLEDAVKNALQHQHSGLALSRLTDLLTTLDIAIGDMSSFGRLPTGGVSGKDREFAGGRLQRVRNSIASAITIAIAEARGDEGSDGNTKSVSKSGVHAIRKLADRFCDGVIITTNWDSFLDRTLWNSEGLSPFEKAKWAPAERSVVYTPIAQEVVNFSGQRINSQLAELPSTPLLKLHGSMNWLSCPRCRRLIINPLLDLASGGSGGKHWTDQTCWCEAEAETLLVTPSYAKTYGNLHLQAIWRDAQQALAEATRWIFVGYSIPTDDAWIRALLTRALAWKRSTGSTRKLEIVVVSHSESPFEAEEAASGKRASSPSTDAFVQTIERYRSLLGEFGEGGRLVTSAQGLESWVDS